MDAKPKSNKIKRLERKRKLEERRERRSRQEADTVTATRGLLAERALKRSDSFRRGTKQLLERIFEGQAVEVSPNSKLFVIAKLFEGIRSRKSCQIVQARQKFNKPPSSKELMILKRWATAGGPSLSKLVAT